MGDVNAKMKRNYIEYEDITGKHGVGIMNENGTHLADYFCDEYT